MDEMSRLVGNLYGQARRGEIDYRVGWIASGFAVARQTCRISGEIEMRLRAMSRREARALIMKAVRDEKACPTMGDVPNFLNIWHYGVPSLERQA